MIAVIDSSNVAWGYVNAQHVGTTEFDRRARPPLRGLVSCINFLLDQGHLPKAICPAWWASNLEHDDGAVLRELIEAGLVHRCPRGVHDDLFVLQYAIQLEQRGAAVAVVSNDMMRDHTASELQLDAEWINAHRIRFMFVDDEFVPDVAGLKLAMDRLASAHADAASLMELEAPLPESFALPPFVDAMEGVEHHLVYASPDEHAAPDKPAERLVGAAAQPRFAAPDVLPIDRRARATQQAYYQPPVLSAASLPPVRGAAAACVPALQPSPPAPPLASVRFAPSDRLPSERRR